MKVFLSYSSTDRKRVLAVKALAQALGTFAFVDARDAEVGRRWEEQILGALVSSDLLIVVWSEGASKSKWVEREYTEYLRARPQGRCFAIQLDACPLPDILQKFQNPEVTYLVDEVRAIFHEYYEKGMTRRSASWAIRTRFRSRGIPVGLAPEEGSLSLCRVALVTYLLTRFFCKEPDKELERPKTLLASLLRVLQLEPQSFARMTDLTPNQVRPAEVGEGVERSTANQICMGLEAVLGVSLSVNQLFEDNGSGEVEARSLKVSMAVALAAIEEKS